MPSDFGSHMLKMVKPQDKVAQFLHHCLEFIRQDICFRLYISKRTSLLGLTSIHLGLRLLQQLHYIN